jgi:single-strand DNA-binding protein
MASENVVTLVGNITDDPELRFTPSGLPVANFTVAVNRRVPKDGGWEDKLEGFFRCSCWRDMAENVAESLTKGSRVMVVGRLQQRSWEDQDGNKRSAVEVQVDEVGPSLRWATARPERSQRSSGGGFGGGGSQPSQSQPPASSGGDSWGPPASVGGSIPDEGGF